MELVSISHKNGFRPQSPASSIVPSFIDIAAVKTKQTRLDIGSIILEFSIDHSLSEPQLLLKSYSHTPVQCCLRIWADADGAISLELRSGHLARRIDLSANTLETSNQLRLTFSWCIEKNKMLLSAENNVTGDLRQAEARNPISMPMSLLTGMLQNADGQFVTQNISLLAVSDQIEPVGLIPSIAGFCPVETPRGFVSIQHIKSGDLVNTVDNGPQPVRWVCSRKVPTQGLFCPIRLRAPYFGLLQDIVIAPEQRLLFENDEVQYMFGEESVLAEAHHFSKQGKISAEPNQANIVLYQLLFDQHEIINVAGCQMESLFVADIANNPDLLSTTLLNELPIDLIPRHTKLARPLLRPYEAMTLAAGTVH